MNQRKFRAVIADDEAGLRASLVRKLAAVAPEVEVCGEAVDGEQALELVQKLRPDVAFLDIRMPGPDGIEVARQIGGLCQVVFVTAYDQYAVKAFERQAVDYLLKPVEDDRLRQCVDRLDGSLQGERIAAICEALQGLRPPPEPLAWINVTSKNITRMISVDNVAYFHAEDKYTAINMINRDQYLINKTIQALEDELSPDHFWRIHRATIVNAREIEHIVRDEKGNRRIKLKGCDQLLNVSRAYVGRFKES